MANWNNRKSSDRSCWSPKSNFRPSPNTIRHAHASNPWIYFAPWLGIESSVPVLFKIRRSCSSCTGGWSRRWPSDNAPYFLVSPERTSFTHFARPESPSASWRLVRAASRDAFEERENVFLHCLSPQVQNVCQICILRWTTIWQCKVTSAMHFIILYSCICICMSSVEVSLIHYEFQEIPGIPKGRTSRLLYTFLLNFVY